jgi:hypothetical protein
MLFPDKQIRGYSVEVIKILPSKGSKFPELTFATGRFAQGRFSLGQTFDAQREEHGSFDRRCRNSRHIRVVNVAKYLPRLVLLPIDRDVLAGVDRYT